MESSASKDANACLCNGVIGQGYEDVEEPGNLDMDIVKNLDSYFEDIEDKLIVSRNVSDWVTRGAISAVEQDAMEKIAQKDLELKILKETLPLYHVGLDGNESMYSMKYNNPRSRTYDYEFNFSKLNGVVDYDKLPDSLDDKLPDSLDDLKFAAKEQFKKLKKEMEQIKGSTSKWADVDEALHSLQTTLEDICIQSEGVVCSSKSLLSNWRQGIEFELEIERSVIKSSIRGLQEEFEQRLWDHNSKCYGDESANWLDIVKEISSLRQEFIAFSKLFNFPESGHLLSHGSLDHRNGSGDHFSSSPIGKENGNHNESTVISVPETLEHVQLKDLSKEELFNYFKTEMTKMKRHHELELQLETEKYFSLKRELYLKEPSSSLKKDKELDSFKKKFPEVILRLDNILTDIQKLAPLSNHWSSLDHLKDRLESLRLENQQLRVSVGDRKKEINFLQSQASDALEQISQHSLVEETLSRKVRDLEWIIADAQVEDSISQDLYKFLLRDVLNQMEGLKEKSVMEYDMMLTIYVNILKEASENAAIVNKLEIEDSTVENIIMQDICASVFGESLKEVEGKVTILNQKYIDEMQVRVAAEMQGLEKENSLKFTLAEKEKLEQENILLRATVDEKSKLLQEGAEESVEAKEKCVLALQELDRLRFHSAEQDSVISKYEEELHVVKNDLAKALDKVETDRRQISQFGEQLEIMMQSLREADEEKIILNSRSQNYQNALSLVEAREAENMKQMKSTVSLIQELFERTTAFEFSTIEDIKRNSLRLGNVSTQFGSLIQKANMLKKTGLQYKQKLEKKSCDLQKAEAEVDLLGDEVDALLSLLEKIYIALDHYSPVLQHYPGIMEILKLVRRELSGESTKSV